MGDNMPGVAFAMVSKDQMDVRAGGGSAALPHRLMANFLSLDYASRLPPRDSTTFFTGLPQHPCRGSRTPVTRHIGRVEIRTMNRHMPTATSQRSGVSRETNRRKNDPDRAHIFIFSKRMKERRAKTARRSHHASRYMTSQRVDRARFRGRECRRDPLIPTSGLYLLPHGCSYVSSSCRKRAGRR